ncbi:hypothetical protein ACFQ1I_40195 [Kitasatospora arboriphila]
MTPDVLGLDQEDRQQVAHWPGGVTEFVTGPVLTPERRRHCLDCAEQLEAHLAPVVERRRHPGDDLVSMLRTAVDDLARDPRRARAREALTAGYFSGAPRRPPPAASASRTAPTGATCGTARTCSARRRGSRSCTARRRSPRDRRRGGRGSDRGRAGAGKLRRDCVSHTASSGR